MPVAMQPAQEAALQQGLKERKKELILPSIYRESVLWESEGRVSFS
jgi:hypothetical protein